jgi:hypothetical protein
MWRRRKKNLRGYIEIRITTNPKAEKRDLILSLKVMFPHFSD